MPQVVNDTIQNGASVSDGASYNADEVLSLVLSGTYTSTSFDIQANIGGTWYDIYDDAGNQLSITVATGKHALPSDLIKDVERVRVSGSAEAAERSIQWIFGTP